ncbi:MAG TPA: hypothetical protein VK997_00935 [Deferrisomatales bacterium]|nr:hypothetical protein [Deferrisomatales bacterium]
MRPDSFPPLPSGASAPPLRGGTWLLFGAVVAFAAATLTAAQAIAVFATGKELCVGQGCALVGQLTRIPPAWFNLFGAAVFAAIGGMAMVVRRSGSRGVFVVLHALLTAAFAAEGVLFAYQWHVAGAWCQYCLVVLGLVAACNVVLVGKGVLFGAAGFTATCAIFSLLSFTPFHRDLDDGTYAVQNGAGGPEFYLLFGEDCPHCQEVEDALAALPGCTVRYNPVTAVTRELFPKYEHPPTYDPRVNLAAATLLGLDQIPILIAKEPTGLQVVTGTAFILDYVQTLCAPQGGGFDPFGSAGPQDTLFPKDDGCGIQVNCD